MGAWTAGQRSRLTSPAFLRQPRLEERLAFLFLVPHPGPRADVCAAHVIQVANSIVAASTDTGRRGSIVGQAARAGSGK